jgi:hypothetical protein
MKPRLALVFGSVLIFSAALVLVPRATAQQGGRKSQGGGRTEQGGGRTAQQNTRSAQFRPRANQGRIPKAPPARSNPAEPRQAEHLPTGHVNDMPHVNHDQWFGHEQPGDARFHQEKPFAHGRFSRVGPTFRYRVTRFDAGVHRFWFSRGGFEVADFDWPLCADWCWNCGDDFTIYEDPDHPGWYLLYNVHTGVYVHVQYLGG